MPELPEVTTTVNGLNKTVVGLKIKDVWCDWHRLIKGRGFDDFRSEIIGRRILRAKRRGKNILIELSGGKTMLVHMKMTGHLMYGKWHEHGAGDDLKWKWVPEDKKSALNDHYNRFIHLMLFLSDGRELAFCDVRKFGKVVLLETKKAAESVDLRTLGLEPLDKSFTLTVLQGVLAKRPNAKIKQVLTNQDLIAGIGNIYADEILWSSGVHPTRKAGEVTDGEAKKIWENTGKELRHGILCGGDSDSDYRNIYGERGRHQNAHNAYRRTGEKCSKRGCDGTIRRMIIGGRSSHYCDKHQK